MHRLLVLHVAALSLFLKITIFVCWLGIRNTISYWWSLSLLCPKCDFKFVELTSNDVHSYFQSVAPGGLGIQTEDRAHNLC